jgi:two-component sensor histidine kinase
MRHAINDAVRKHSPPVEAKVLLRESVASAVGWFTRRSHSTGTWILAVVYLSGAGAVIVGASAGWYSWHQEKLRLGANLIATSRALAELTDQELTQADLVAHALASSEFLGQDALQGFSRQAIEVGRPFGYFTILSKVDSSRELMDTRLPLGATLRTLPRAWVMSAGAQPKARPVVRDADGHWVAAVQLVGPEKTYVITIGIPVARFQSIIDREKLPPKWSSVILDQDWTIVARGVDPEKYVGHTGANREVMDLPGPDRTYEAAVLEGYRGFDARSRSERYGWTAAVAVPQSLLFVQFLRPAVSAALAGFLISLLAVGAIMLFSLRLLRDIRLLASATEQLASGEFDSVPDLSIRELEAVAEGMRDASSQLRAEERFRQLAVEELAHRLRNKVATIQAILSFPLRDHPDLRDAIIGRLRALSATDQLIIDTQGRGADLGTIIKAELGPYEASRIVAEGPDVFLAPKLALTIALVFHELATNAAKYGAFSNDSGRVSISWSVTEDLLNLEWRERDGPSVSEPEHQGFGAQLIGSALGAFSGTAEIRFEPTGLIVVMSATLREGSAPASKTGATKTKEAAES